MHSKETLERYVKRRRQDLLNCRQALENGQLDHIREVGHRLKGSADLFGFSELAVLGRELEIWASEHQLPPIQDGLHRFEEWLHRQSADQPLG